MLSESDLWKYNCCLEEENKQLNNELKETEKRLRELYSNFNKRVNISTDRASESIFIYCRDQIKSKFPEFFKENDK